MEPMRRSAATGRESAVALMIRSVQQLAAQVVGAG